MIDALLLAPQRPKRQLCLALKLITLWRFHLTLVFYVFQLYGVKVVKIDFSNNQIGEIKKKMTFQGVFMYK